MAAATPVGRGRPRDERIDAEITAAALDVIAEGGFDGFAVETVAARAGVAKTTVYRRFPCRGDLLVGALQRLNDELPPPPPPGPVRDRLVAYLADIRRRTPDTRGRILMHAAAEGARDPELADLVQQRVLQPRRQVLRDILEQAITAGELRPDIDVDAAIPALVGPMIYLGMWGMTPQARSVHVESVVDLVLTGMSTRATGS